ncbi:CU044_2847 family protein [Streptomyces sp. NPDC054794]
MRPAVEAARAVLDRVREVCPAEVEVKFGVKATWDGALVGGQGCHRGEL